MYFKNLLSTARCFGLIDSRLGAAKLVCMLYFVEQASYQEIAEMVGCPVGTVRSRLHRGRRMLQKALWNVAQEHGIIDRLAGTKGDA